MLKNPPLILVGEEVFLPVGLAVALKGISQRIFAEKRLTVRRE
jgi:hypothetical protein